jgi:hypothetical protein
MPCSIPEPYIVKNLAKSTSRMTQPPGLFV